MNFRTDIQALRGFAVLIVLLYHANLGLLEGGYLGVDVFFVISGYLITGIVKRGIEQGDFRFSEFYFRRMKRLLPAAYVTFFVTICLSFWFLDTSELKGFYQQFIGAITLTGNISVWRQTGYFEDASALKPLLHVWSLSLEEQYYLLLPSALFYLPRRFWRTGISLVLIVSLALCLILVPIKPFIAFYLLPTRAWEFAMGSLVAMMTWNTAQKNVVLSKLFWPSVLLLIFLPVFPVGNLYPFLPGAAHPGIDAVIICIATVIVILRRHEALNSNFLACSFAKVGDFSYSLYLVHWPIFAFMNNAYVKEPPLLAHLISLPVVFCIGFLLYKYVELPMRYSELKMSRPSFYTALAVSLILVLIPVGLSSFYAPITDQKKASLANYGFGISCISNDFSHNFIAKDECRNSNQPRFLVWGDSYAMHLIPGIAETTGTGVAQATRSLCGPLIGLAPMANSVLDRSWAKHCLEFNQSVFEYLATNSSIKIVVMSSFFSQYLAPSTGKILWRSLALADGHFFEHQPSSSETLLAIERTIKKLRAIGKRVVIVAPPPSSNFDIGRCLKRKAAGMLIWGTYNDCNIPIADYHEVEAPVLKLLQRVRNELDVPVVSFDQSLCSESLCVTSLENTVLYLDKGHLTDEGSRILAKKNRLGDLLEAVAK
jgi:peptidoglycan/LPS O-acetylase OafA/YrhL